MFKDGYQFKEDLEIKLSELISRVIHRLVFNNCRFEHILKKPDVI